MGVFRVTFTKNGRKQRSGNFYIDFKDAAGIRRRVPAYRGQRESQELERTIEKLVACRCNNALPGADLVRCIESMPAKVRDRLTVFGVLDKCRQHAARTITDHLGDYKAELVAKGASETWATLVHTRALAVLTEAGCKSLSALNEGDLLLAADRLRQTRHQSDATYNHHLSACKQFSKWLVRGKRMNADPLLGVKGRNAKANRVHQRRALTATECRALLARTETGRDSHGMTGPERALLYRLALETGLRANELRTLTRSAFQLGGKQPSVTVAARHAKNRKAATLPLRPVMAGLLAHHVANMLPGAMVFSAMPQSNHTAEMLKADLAAANIEYEVENQFADFHALRHTFITNLARAGVMPNVAKELARHSTITLTMDYYTHTSLGDHAAAAAKLPDLDVGKLAETA
ncbi:MAG: tyrosine-type recombinase/integrase [Planctomycetes bacterium]|nr:tyrosine-type recombinase/integrase [Planctomycetota bacterium]